MIKKYNALTYAFIAAVFTGCATQPPAPVVDGRAGVRTAYTPAVRQTPTTPVKSTRPQMVGTHTVQAGENLTVIARKYGMDADELMEVNDLTSPDLLRIGQKLKIQKSSEGARYSLTRREIPAPLVTTPVVATPVKEEPKPVSYTRHMVKAGENLFRIGLRYEVSPLDIMAENDINKPEALKAGTILRIPVDNVKDVTPSEEQAIVTINRKAAQAKGFIWPVRGKVIEGFGPKEAGVTNTGIKILVPENTQIMAAEQGTVIYADNGLASYGNLILLRHQNGLITAYAHNSKNLVKRDTRVAKGQVIALAGKTGNTDRPLLHFEVRRRARAIDPMTILPKQ